MEKGEPKNLVAGLLDIIHPHSTAPPSLPPFLSPFPFALAIQSLMKP